MFTVVNISYQNVAVKMIYFMGSTNYQVLSSDFPASIDLLNLESDHGSSIGPLPSHVALFHASIDEHRHLSFNPLLDVEFSHRSGTRLLVRM